MTKTYQGQTYRQSETDTEIWIDEAGRQHATFEIKDIKTKIRYWTKQMDRAAKDLTDYDNACQYSEAADQRLSEQEDLELLEYLAA